jgi:hypothetical protein
LSDQKIGCTVVAPKRSSETMRTVTLVNADVKILIAAMTFFALLAILLTPDGCFSSGFPDLGSFPVPE